MRAFLAVNLSTQAIDQMVSYRETLREAATEADMRVAWVPPPNMHVTLKFLGDIADESAATIRAKLGEVLQSWPPFRVTAQGTGAFPQRQQPRILWVGVASEDNQLTLLAETIETALAELGFAEEKRPFHAHVTLGRVKAGQIDLLAKANETIDASSDIREVVLYRSELQRAGAEYTPVARIPLGPKGETQLSGGRRMAQTETVNSEKAINLAVASIEKQFGRGAIMRLGDDDRLIRDLQVISTGSLGLDIALGVGGVPRGRVIEIFGPESSGKTTLALQIVAQAQKTGGVCAFIDAEHALDVQYARNLGVKTDELLISQPDFGEQALEITDLLVRSSAVSVIVIDSVAALIPKAELEGDMGDVHVGRQARLMSQALRKLTATVAKSGTLVIFINQIRMKIGVMFGSPETTTGGNALKFYASMRLDIRRIGAIKQGDSAIGNRTRVKVVKNKLAPPFRSVEFDIMYGEGISSEGDLIDLATEHRIVDKSGAWYTYGTERVGQGRENAKQFLKNNPEIARTIRQEILTKVGLTEKPSSEQKAAAAGPTKAASATAKNRKN